MKGKIRLFVVVMGLFVLLAAGVVQAAVETISLWELSPDPVATNEEVVTNISFSSDTDGSDTHRFCIEGPTNAGNTDANWHGTMPMTITLQASQGFDSELVDFVKDDLANSQSVCPGGLRVALYDGTISNTVDIDINNAIDFTTNVGSIIDLDAGGNVASAGTGNWGLFLASPVGIGSLTYNLELTDAPSSRYISDTAGCGGNTPCDDTADTMLQDAIDALPTGGGTVIVYQTATITNTQIGASDVLLQGYDANAILQSNGTGCSSVFSAVIIGNINPLLVVDGAGSLTIDNLTVQPSVGTCDAGIVTQSTGDVTIQNSTVISGWVEAGLVGESADATVTIDSSSFTNNGRGAAVGATNSTISDSVFSDNTLLGLFFSAVGTHTVVGNQFIDNAGDGLTNAGGSVTAYANEFTGNSAGNSQATVASGDNFAKNWWGSASDSDVGPAGDGTVATAAWNARLGSDIESYAAGTGTVTLGDATLGGGSGTGVIIDLGSSSGEAPFGVGLIPFVNLACSPFYDFYGVDNATGWTVGLPINTSMSGCSTLVLANEVAYVINDVSECAAPGDSACWDPIPTSDIVASGGDTLLISNLTLDGTHIVAGESGVAADPTAVTLANIGANSDMSTTFVLILGLLFTFGTGLFVFWKRRSAV